ncbi:MAG: DUF2157 domain-containing protein [Alcanivorax sediminis]|uniref:DUF2157 domain-containing protein n=1 Tax=Alcanivorax sediminis TaxID=2663008 RepID=A0A6N7LZ51_9GAMM|nr:DUF2157 domain-containing protein [Alcanivorax sediminis]MQX54706.1 DUF2157 domain-containing protein [Alcanivorax sediminis]
MQLLGLLRRELRSECRQWVQDGDITAEQGDRILARYGTRLDDVGDGSLAYKVLVGVALLFVGMALLLLVSANWEEIPRALRMLGLIGMTMALNGVGIRYYLKDGSGLGWLFVGSISYGASIMLIAQIYHLGEHYPDGLFYWALGIAPMALLVRSRVLALLMLTVALLWLFNEGKFSPPWQMLLFLAAAFGVARQSASAGLGVVTVAVAVCWLNILLAWIYGYPWRPDFDTGNLTMNMGLLALLFMLGHWLAPSALAHRRRAATLLSLWALRGYLILLIPFTFYEVCEAYLRELQGVADPGLWFGLLAAIPAGLLALRDSSAHPLSRGLVMGVPLVLLMLHGMQWEAIVLPMVILVNLLALVSAIVLIQQGLEKGYSQYFYSGVGLLLVLAMIRYVDLVGDYVGGAVMFLIAAAILYAAARYWRDRQLQGQGGQRDE